MTTPAPAAAVETDPELHADPADRTPKTPKVYLEARRRQLLGPGKGIHWKLHRLFPLAPECQGTAVFVTGFDDPGLTVDLEKYCQEWCKTNGEPTIVSGLNPLGPAAYRLRAFMHDGGGKVAFEYLFEPWQFGLPPPGSTGSTGPTSAMITMMKDITEIQNAGGRNNGFDAAGNAALISLVKPVIEGFVTRLATPAPPAPAENSSQNILMTELIRRALNPPPPPPPVVPAAPSIAEGLGMQLLNGALPRMVEAALTGGVVAAPATSGWAEAGRVLGGLLTPLVGYIPSVLTSWNQMQANRARELEVRRLEALAALATRGIPLPGSETAGALPGPAPAAERPAGVSAAPAAAVPPGPLAPFRHAIIEGQHTEFPRLVETLVGIHAEPLLDGLRDGSVTLAMIQLQPGAREGFPELFLPGAEPFFAAFAAWLRTQAGVHNGTGPVSGRCDACGTTFTAPTPAELPTTCPTCAAARAT